MDSCITLVYPMDVPVVFDNHLEDNPGIQCGSEPWFYWLDQPEVKSFNYNLGLGVRFLARKRLNKDGSALWSAHKKVGGEMRVLGLGRTENLTPETLSTIAQALTNLDKDAWNEFKTNRTTAKAPAVGLYNRIKCIASECTSGENERPSTVTEQSPLALGHRIVELESRIAELETELTHVKQERDDYAATVTEFIKDGERRHKERKELEAKAFNEEKAARILQALGVGRQALQYKRVQAAIRELMK